MGGGVPPQTHQRREWRHVESSPRWLRLALHLMRSSARLSMHASRGTSCTVVSFFFRPAKWAGLVRAFFFDAGSRPGFALFLSLALLIAEQDAHALLLPLNFCKFVSNVYKQRNKRSKSKAGHQGPLREEASGENGGVSVVRVGCRLAVRRGWGGKEASNATLPPVRPQLAESNDTDDATYQRAE